MENRHRPKQKKNKRPRSAPKSSPEIREIRSIGEFREKYLPRDEVRRSAHHMTPMEVGEELARTSLTAAEHILAG